MLTLSVFFFLVSFPLGTSYINIYLKCKNNGIPLKIYIWSVKTIHFLKKEPSWLTVIYLNKNDHIKHSDWECGLNECLLKLIYFFNFFFMFLNYFDIKKILKNIKNILIYLQAKNTLKSNRNHTPKHPLSACLTL
jgi:hypothetical protein